MKSKTSKEFLLNWFETVCPEYIELMKASTHDHLANNTKSPYHLEGDVWTHTLMVYNTPYGDKYNEVLIAKLLHDIGKPITRHEKENGRVSFYDHENASMWMSIPILTRLKHDTPIEFNFHETLMLINWHDDLNFHGKFHKDNEIDFSLNDKEKSFLNSKYTNPEFYKKMVQLNKADNYGRETTDDLEYFNLDKFGYLENYIPYKANNNYTQTKKVVMMIGPSGSGKSHLVNEMLSNKLNNFKVLSFDNELNPGKLNYNSVDYSKKNVKKAHDNVVKKMNEYIKNNENVIIDMTNLDKETRRKKLSKFPSNTYMKIAYVFIGGGEVIEDRNSKREGKNIPQEVLVKQVLNFKLPSHEEFDKIIFVEGKK